jgi:hypothetical protein
MERGGGLGRDHLDREWWRIAAACGGPCECGTRNPEIRKCRVGGTFAGTVNSRYRSSAVATLLTFLTLLTPAFPALIGEGHSSLWRPATGQSGGFEWV